MMSDFDPVKRYEEMMEDDAPQVIMSERVVLCYLCYERVAMISLAELNVPMRGYMFSPLPGTEHWPLPLPNDGPRDFTCPHAQDGHLFVPYLEGEETNTLRLDDGSLYTVKRICPCGCGDEVVPPKKYAHGLQCRNRLLKMMGGKDE